MSHDQSGSTIQRAPRGLDGRVLVSNLVAGSAWIVVLAVASWPSALVGAFYVVGSSVFFAGVYARPTLTLRQEVAAWVAPWLAAIALCMWVLGSIEDGISGDWLTVGWAAVVVATPCCVVWQATALAVRQFMAWRDREATT